MKYIVEIMLLKPENENLVKELNLFGLKNIKRVIKNKIYSISGDIDKNKIDFIAKELLVDPIVENYKILTKIKKNPSQTIVNIWYRPEVLDVVSLYVKKGIKYLGLEEELEIHSGTQIWITPKVEEKKIKSIIEKNFMNPLIQQYEII